jgi:hypothetical protein
MPIANKGAVLATVLVFVAIGAVALGLSLAPVGSEKAQAVQQTMAPQAALFDLERDVVSEGSMDSDAVSLQQAAALADNYVTWDEYEAGIWAAFTCIKDAGYEPLSEPHLNAVGTGLRYSFRSDGRSGSVLFDCQIEHSMHVEQIWAGQSRPSAEVLAAAETDLRDCLVANGYDQAEVEAAESFISLAGRDEHFGACVRQVSVDHKVGWWAGD